MRFRREVVPFIAAVLLVAGIAVVLFGLFGLNMTAAAFPCSVIAFVSIAYLLYFFRDPERTPPSNPDAVLAAADGRIASITNMQEDTYLNADTVRISIFLGLFDVHVNRAPISGCVRRVHYQRGRHLAAYRQEASDYGERITTIVENNMTVCRVDQIVGVAARRVVSWLEEGQEVSRGEKIGMMKFGSRLDTYLPSSDFSIRVSQGQRVVAGETILAERKRESVS